MCGAQRAAAPAPHPPTPHPATARNRINKTRRAGYEVLIVPGPETSAAQRAGFLAAYEQTMRRAAAAEHYFFAAAYFDRILESDLTCLALALAPGGEIAAASVAARSDGFLHYYLSGRAAPHSSPGGRADAQLRNSPMKNVVAALIEHAAAEGLPLNLGGGIARGDALEEVMRGFAHCEQAWHTSEAL